MPRNAVNDNQERIVELLEELLVWTKAAAVPQVKKVLTDLLQSDEQKRAFLYSDGRRRRDEVAKLSGCGGSTISKWWKIWIGAGIAESIAARGGSRAKGRFSLDEFGIKVPRFKKVAKGKDKLQQVETHSHKENESVSPTEQSDSSHVTQTGE